MPPERLTPESGEGGLHAPDGAAVVVASNAEVDEPVPLIGPDAERVRFARGTCSLAPLAQDTVGAEWELERTPRAWSYFPPYSS